jgi:superfamily II DNA or RNA helicase
MASVQLRPFQAALKSDVYAAWQAGARNVLAVAPTGSGKTVLFSDILHEYPGASVAIAHRSELVSQISLALARNGVRHRLIGQPALVRTCVSIHIAETGRSYYDPSSRCAAAGVDTLIRMEAADPWFARVGLWVQDEAHHLLAENKWGTASAMFPNAHGLGVTATPVRADGKGLGRHADGLMDVMVQAPGMRSLIQQGYLTDYRIFAPPSDLDLSAVGISAGGDFSPDPLRKAVHASHILGDVVAHYLKIAAGKLGVTFAVDVEHAGEIAQAYRAAGVPAEVVSAKTPDAGRASILRRFARGEVKQLVNVDLFGEGFDLPALECVSMARPTQSFALYAQQFGRSLRPMEGKAHALIIDHVGNVHRHGLPDAPREWSLDRRERHSASKSDVVPVRTCPECAGTYDRVLGPTCPYCSYTVEPVGRSSPEQVDGDLAELTPEALARLRGEIDAAPAFHPDPLIAKSLVARQREKQEAQEALRAAMAQWGGYRAAAGDDVYTAQRRFYLTYGVDVATAQTLGRAEAEALRARLGV